ncbi:MAG TPA: hypothetical protein PL067_09495 [Bacteroidales bacterium]|nr:hypothetical protein [Candidatus Fermentibacter daniensis]HPO40944.1 hypothetical protein [Bacteroidales bacterium]
MGPFKAGRKRPEPTLWEAIEVEANRISEEYGLDSRRVLRVAEALLHHSTRDNPNVIALGQDGITTAFHLEELLEAIECLGAQEALTFFESCDIKMIFQRYRTFLTLTHEWQPIYSIRELGELADSIRKLLKAHEVELCRNGCFHEDSLSFGPIFAPLFNLLKANPLLTEEVRQSPDDGTNEKEVVELRRELFSIQDHVLELVDKSCREGWPASNLRVSVIKLFDEFLTDRMIDRCLELEGVEEVFPKQDDAIPDDAEYPFGGRFLGGFKSILQVLCHVEEELEFHVFDAAYTNFHGFIEHGPRSSLRRLRGKYFRCISRPEAERLNRALDEFHEGLSKAQSHGKEFRREYSAALIDEHPVYMLGVRVPKRINKGIRNELKGYLRFLVDFYERNGALPKKVRFVPESPKVAPVDMSVIFNGSTWSIGYEGGVTTFSDMVGFHYIRMILRSHPMTVGLKEVAGSIDRRSHLYKRRFGAEPADVQALPSQTVHIGCDTSSVVDSTATEGQCSTESLGGRLSLGHEESDFSVINSPTWSDADEHETDEKTITILTRRKTLLLTMLDGETDTDRREVIQKELEDIENYLKSTTRTDSTGSVKPKKVKDPSSENLRLAIRTAIDRSLIKVRTDNPGLADDLKAIKIGSVCRYVAPADKVWRT